MSPDDPRHGTHAGAIQHWRDGGKPCEPCAVAARRLRKSADLDAHNGRPRTVELGDLAWRITKTTPLNQLCAQTGMNQARIIRYRNGGPTKKVHRRTRDRILQSRVQWTAVGIQRRLQALTCLGWSMRVVSDLAGVDMDALKRLRSRTEPKFVRLEFADAVIAAYDALHMKTPPNNKSTQRTLAHAARQPWVTPLHWDNIDTDPEPPAALYDEPGVDPVVVMRLLEGVRVKANKAEKEAAMRQWVADGGSRAELARMHGWKAERYTAHLRLVGEAS